MKRLLVISNRKPGEKGGRPEKLAARGEFLRESDWEMNLVKVNPTFLGIVTGVIRAKSALRHNDFDVVLSMCNPPHLHLVGLIVRNFTSVPWVAEFRDPLVTIPAIESDSFQARYRKWIESLVVRTADQIIWPDGIQLDDDYFDTQYADQYDRNWYKLPFMGYRTKKFDDAESTSFDQFTITYAGSFYDGWIEPYSFLSGFQQFVNNRDLSPAEAKFLIYGDWDESYSDTVAEYGLSEFVETFDFIPHDDLIPILKGSDVLLYIGGKDPRNRLNVPTKIWDYIGAGNPILAVVNSEFRVASFITEHQVGVVADYSDPVGIAESLSNLYDAKIEIDGEIARKEFTRDRHSEALVDVLEHVADGTHKTGTWNGL